MNIMRLVVFKNEHRVDWYMTKANIYEFVYKAAPHSTDSEKALWAADIEKNLRSWVKEFTVPLCYRTIQTMTVQGKPK